MIEECALEPILKKVQVLAREIGIANAAALQFLTIVHPFVRQTFTGKEMGQAVGCFPLVGLLIGAVLAVQDWLLGGLLQGVNVPLLLTVWVLLTGALHMDGLLDTCDGLFGGQTPEERLEIMRDPRVGAFGVIGGVLFLLLKAAALGSAPHRTAVLLLAPTLARWSLAFCVICFPYARPEGLGRTMKDNATWAHFCLASILAGFVTVLAAIICRDFLVLLLPGAVLLASWSSAKFVMGRIRGLTGDVYGAICELMELLVLVLFVVLIPSAEASS